METKVCDCGRTIASTDSNSWKWGACFKCRALGTGFTFRGGGQYGRKTFNDYTNGEFIRQHIDPADGETQRHR